ncbi:hypothetical protein SLS56_007319 [Neofusicoccum ribis]|uniref:Peptidase A1 domain-containing protein n=1 Tax=Neofusicoccum ribis TaxID=45134 RepID=A0ABR3SN69_9PEZI
MKRTRLGLLGLALLAQAQIMETQIQPRDTVTTLAAPLSLAYAISKSGCPSDYYPSAAEDADSVKDCEDSRGGMYARDNSSDYVDDSPYALHIDDNLGYSGVSGQFGFDTVGLGYRGDGGTVNHQVVASIGRPEWWFGVLPLNPRPTNLSDINNPQNSLLQSLKNGHNISSLSWGYTAGAKYRSENFFGSLTLGGYDSARFDNTSQTVAKFAGDDERDLTVLVNEITTNVSSEPLVSQSIAMMIDSTVPYLYLPDFAYKAFETAFNLEWNSTLQLYIMDATTHDALVDQNPEISFNVGSSDPIIIRFPIQAFLLNASFPLVPGNQSQYYFPIKRANDTDQYTLGRVFLQEAYVMADYERRNFTLAPCVWPDDTTQSPPSAPMIIRSINETSNPTESNGGNSLSAGAIAGAVVGGIIAGLLLAALFACIYIRRRRRRRQRESIKPSSVAHTRNSSSATLPGGRPRAGSRIASFFRNPWGSFDADAVVPGHFELAVDPSGLTPAEEELARQQREHKRHHSNELDAEVSALHEMYQPKPERLEMQGDEPFPTYVSGDGGTIDGNALRAEHADAERRKRAELAGVYEMDATGGLLLFGGGSGTATPTPLPSPPMPSPGQIDAVTRKEREERERLEAERAHAERVRAEELQERVGAGAADAIEPVDGATGERPDAERRVSDLSPISENGTFARSPVSARPDSGSRRVSRD